MTYSDIYLKKPAKIPTAVGVLILFLIIGIFIRVSMKTSIPSRATKKTLQRMSVANLSPNQATIYWQTDGKETGWLVYGNDPRNLSNVALDDRDLPDKKNFLLNHLVTLKDLKPHTAYYFKIVSSNALVSDTGNRPFGFTTPNVFSTPQNINPVYGKVIQQNGLPLTDAAVEVEAPDSYPLLTLSKSSGEWLLPLNNMVNVKTLMTQTISNTTALTVTIVAENGTVSTIHTTVDKAAPIPQTIIIGKSYDFTKNNVLGAQATAVQKTAPIDIIYPKENSMIPGFTPLVKGVMLPDSTGLVTILAGSKTVTSKVKSDNKGEWTMYLTDKLPLGKHTVTLTTKNASGKDVRVEKSFLIIANQGNDASVLGVASGEPTLTETPLTATPVPTFEAASPSGVLTAQPTTPVSGSNVIPQVFGAASLIILGIGMMLVF